MLAVDCREIEKEWGLLKAAKAAWKRTQDDMLAQVRQDEQGTGLRLAALEDGTHQKVHALQAQLKCTQAVFAAYEHRVVSVNEYTSSLCRIASGIEHAAIPPLSMAHAAWWLDYASSLFP